MGRRRRERVGTHRGPAPREAAESLTAGEVAASLWARFTHDGAGGAQAGPPGPAGLGWLSGSPLGLGTPLAFCFSGPLQQLRPSPQGSRWSLCDRHCMSVFTVGLERPGEQVGLRDPLASPVPTFGAPPLPRRIAPSVQGFVCMRVP